MEENTQVTPVIETKETKKPHPYLVPIAIVVAGALVAGAVLLKTNGDSKVVEPARFYKELAESIGVNGKKFDQCIQERRYKEKVQADFDLGVQLGVTGTPGNFVNGVLLRGALPYEDLRSVVRVALEGKKEELKKELVIVEQDHIRGVFQAPVTILEFSDLQCPFCKQFQTTMQRLMQEFGGNVRWVYKHFPLESIHAEAWPSAEASECVWEQKGNEGFWEFIDQVFINQQKLTL